MTTDYKRVESITIENEESGKRLDEFLDEVLEGLTRSYIKKLIVEGHIYIEGSKKNKGGTKLKVGNEVVIRVPVDEDLDVKAQDIDIDIIYEDSDMVVINKAPDMVVHPAPGNYQGTLVNAILYHVKDLSNINGVIRPGIVHRLDKDTSGVIIVAKNNESHHELTKMFKEKTIKKTYLCIVRGTPKIESGRIENYIGRSQRDRKKMTVTREDKGKIAISNYKVLGSGSGHSLIKVGIETGRTHQIRVHMRELGHPIIGDRVYGSSKDKVVRQMLHAYKLEFKHPITGKEMVVEGDIPEDFKNELKKLGLDGVGI